MLPTRAIVACNVVNRSVEVSSGNASDDDTDLASIEHVRMNIYGIGMSDDAGTIPWSRTKGLPADKKYVKRTTVGEGANYLVMGRRTFASIRKALPGRVNIIVSSLSALELLKLYGTPVMEADDVAVEVPADVAVRAKDYDAAMKFAYEHAIVRGTLCQSVVWIFGGLALYEEYVTRGGNSFYVTTLTGQDYGCNVTLPSEWFEPDGLFKRVSVEEGGSAVDEAGKPIEYQMLVMRR